jgi:hypothetical protein
MVSHVPTGACLAKLCASDARLSQEERHALAEVTCLHYAAEAGLLLLGDQAGMLHVWAP